MAFLVHSTDDHRAVHLEYHPVSAIVPKVGMAMVMTSGKLAVAAGTTKPQYICMTQRESACQAGEIIPVIRVAADIVLETSFSTGASANNLGSKVTVSADGMQVTSTTTDGVAEVIYMDGTEAGSMCRVRFV